MFVCLLISRAIRSRQPTRPHGQLEETPLWFVPRSLDPSCVCLSSPCRCAVHHYSMPIHASWRTHTYLLLSSHLAIESLASSLSGSVGKIASRSSWQHGWIGERKRLFRQSSTAGGHTYVRLALVVRPRRDDVRYIARWHEPQRRPRASCGDRHLSLAS